VGPQVESVGQHQQGGENSFGFEGVQHFQVVPSNSPAGQAHAPAGKPAQHCICPGGKKMPTQIGSSSPFRPGPLQHIWAGRLGLEGGKSRQHNGSPLTTPQKLVF
jgi:hypothetical protein